MPVGRDIAMPYLPLVPDANTEIAQQLDNLRRHTQETGEDLRRMEQEQESFALQYHECTKLNGNTVLNYWYVLTLRNILKDLHYFQHSSSAAFANTTSESAKYWNRKEMEKTERSSWTHAKSKGKYMIVIDRPEYLRVKVFFWSFPKYNCLEM